MLIISRKKDQKIILADDIEITILEVGRNRVRFGIKAPKHIPIHTRLKTSPIPDQTGQIIEMETRTSPLDGLPAAVGIPKRRTTDF
jgi:carbon storage regulator